MSSSNYRSDYRTIPSDSIYAAKCLESSRGNVLKDVLQDLSKDPIAELINMLKDEKRALRFAEIINTEFDLRDNQAAQEGFNAKKEILAFEMLKFEMLKFHREIKIPIDKDKIKRAQSIADLKEVVEEAKLDLCVRGKRVNADEYLEFFLNRVKEYSPDYLKFAGNKIGGGMCSLYSLLHAIASLLGANYKKLPEFSELYDKLLYGEGVHPSSIMSCLLRYGALCFNNGADIFFELRALEQEQIAKVFQALPDCKEIDVSEIKDLDKEVAVPHLRDTVLFGRVGSANASFKSFVMPKCLGEGIVILPKLTRQNEEDSLCAISTSKWLPECKKKLSFNGKEYRLSGAMVGVDHKSMGPAKKEAYGNAENGELNHCIFMERSECFGQEHWYLISNATCSLVSNSELPFGGYYIAALIYRPVE